MAGYIRLQILLVAVGFGNQLACGHASKVIYHDEAAPSGLYFPSDGVTDPSNRRVANIPRRPAVAPDFIRQKARPPCSQVIDSTNIEAAPCISDEQYNEKVQRYISELLTQTRSVNEIIQDPMLRVILNDTLTPFEPISPSTRFGGIRETPVCGAQEELIFPQRAKTPKDDWVFVVNQPDVKQALRVEKCTGEGRPCNIGGAPTREFTTVCRQKYVYRRMLVLGSNNIQPEEVLMPSCCVCYSRRETTDIATRININSSDAPDPEDRSPNQPPLAGSRTNGPNGTIVFYDNYAATRAHMTPVAGLHSNARRGAIQQAFPFFLQGMRYR